MDAGDVSSGESSSLSTSILLPPGHQVSVDVHGHLKRVVSHLFLDVGEGSALLNKERCERMPETMLTNMSQPGFLEDRKEDSMSDIVAIKHPSRF